MQTRAGVWAEVVSEAELSLAKGTKVGKLSARGL